MVDAPSTCKPSLMSHTSSKVSIQLRSQGGKKRPRLFTASMVNGGVACVCRERAKKSVDRESREGRMMTLQRCRGEGGWVCASARTIMKGPK